MPKPKAEPAPTELQTIDPTALANVSGGAGGTDPAVMQALTGVLDSLQSLSNQRQQGGGFGPTEMMMFMMMMGGRNNQPQVVAQAPGTIGGYAGYTIDGVYYPFR